MTIVEVRLPDLGEGLVEATVLSWYVGPGDVVAMDQALCEVETDKAQVQLPAPHAGRIVQINAPPGAVVAVGAVLASLEPETAASPAPPLLVGPGPPPDTTVRRRRAVADLGPPFGAPAPPPTIAAVTAAPATTGAVVPSDGYWAAMAAKMAQSHREIPAASATREVDATVLLAAAAAQPPVSPFVLLLRLVGRALLGHPRLRGQGAIADRAAIDRAAAADRADRAAATDVAAAPAAVNVAFAVDTPHGLAAPVICDVAGRAVGEVAAEVARLTEAARQRSLAPADVRGACFTVTNHGVFGTDDAVPVVVPGQAAILAVGMIKPRVVAVGDTPTVRPTVRLTVVFDHRSVDGANAARFLADLADGLDHAEELRPSERQR